jgi:hypothetical protein
MSAADAVEMGDLDLGVRMVVKTYDMNSGTTENAWDVLVERGAHGDLGVAFDLLANAVGEGKAREILTSIGVDIP